MLNLDGGELVVFDIEFDGYLCNEDEETETQAGADQEQIIF